MNDFKRHRNESEMEGWLHKWTNYLKGGYKKRWFVLSNGLLSYYRNQTDSPNYARCTLSLQGVMIHTIDANRFVISHEGRTLHLKATSKLEKAQWVMTLELAKMKAIRTMELEDEDVVDFEGGGSMRTMDPNELESVIETLIANLEDMKICNELVTKYNNKIQLLLNQVGELDNSSADLSETLGLVKDQCNFYRTLANNMTKTSIEFAELAQTQGRKWQRLMKHEHEHSQQLEEMVEQLAHQHSNLELAAIKATSNQHLYSLQKSLISMDEYFDAEDNLSDLHSSIRRRTIGSDDLSNITTCEIENDWPVARMGSKKSKKISFNSDGNSGEKQSERSESLSSTTTSLSNRDFNSGKRKRRKTIPEKPNYRINLWNILKNFVGKDLTKIPIPVNFSEPLSLLQRLIEEFEYSEILDHAAQCKDSCEQLAYVAAFTVSPYSTTTVRNCKPFNPLLGETYECDRRDDLGWWAISEQVNHHPPIAAQYCEGRGWTCWQEYSMCTKFRGMTLQLNPLGIQHLYFHETGNHYSWRKVTITVHNIIIGKLWIEQHGEMDVINHITGEKCHLIFAPYKFFSREIPRKVTGEVFDREGNIHWSLSGTWDNRIEGCKVLSNNTNQRRGSLLQNDAPIVLWSRRMPPPENEKMYNFTEFTMQLNEPDIDVAPTDSRHRPDQRLMENQLWDEANHEKVRLEEKQRAVRRRREEEMELASAEGREYPAYEPLWFKQEVDPFTGNLIHIYQKKYLFARETQDWTACPDIF